ncbi:hypothetical protein SALBM217S_04240 [Streptomyces griseoloalbus]
MVSRVVADPVVHRPGHPAPRDRAHHRLGRGLRIDLEPAACGDPDCEADHGYTGSSTADDLSLRVSEAGDGPETVRQALAFAQALSEATADPAPRPTPRPPAPDRGPLAPDAWDTTPSPSPSAPRPSPPTAPAPWPTCCPPSPPASASPA